MTSLRYAGVRYECTPEETVLDTLLRHGVAVANSCRKGVCCSCMMRAADGRVAASAQAGLKDSLIAQNYFLACQHVPAEDLTLEAPGEAVFAPATVVYSEALAESVRRVVLLPDTPLSYRPGQFINLRRPDGLVRSYSLANLPGAAPELEIHVKRLPGGAMSGWIFDALSPGDRVEIAGPHGGCFYLPGREDQNLLLIGTGTGLSPLIGVVRDALHSGHRGEIHLFHGSRSADGLYLQDELHALSDTHFGFHYHPCVSGGPTPAGHLSGRADKVAFERFPALAEWRLFLCGLPAMVHAARRTAYLDGASLADIYADAFELSAPDEGKDTAVA